MTRRFWLAIATLLSAAAEAAPAAPACRPDTPGVPEIRAVASGIVAADNRRDIERVLDYYAADAVLMPPGEPPVVGREKIRPRYEALFERFTPEIEVRIDEACVGAGLGFVRGHNGGRMIPRDSGDVRVLDDVFLMLLRFEPERGWRISHLMWHRQAERSPTPVGE